MFKKLLRLWRIRNQYLRVNVECLHGKFIPGHFEAGRAPGRWGCKHGCFTFQIDYVTGYTSTLDRV